MVHTTKGARQTLAWSAVAALVAVGASGCSAGGKTVVPGGAGAVPSVSGAPDATAGQSLTRPGVSRAQVAITPQDGASAVRPDAVVAVSATDGTLKEVAVRDTEGALIEGKLNADRTSWTAEQRLRPKTRYQVTATAVDTAGVATTKTAKLRTLTPKDSASYSVLPSGNKPVGVGMPVVIQFASAVATDKRADVERRVHIEATPAIDGQWGWLDGRQLVWRPAKYWTPGTSVHVTADIAGVETRPGLWTTHNADVRFRVGAAMVSTVNTKTHQMTVTRNGKVLRVLKVSTGKPGSETETRRGIKIIISREAKHVMDSATIGIKKGQEGYYNIPTEWAMRLTWSGEFLHSAPWSVGSQGSANVSHGCTNLSPTDAKWLFDRSTMGDVVEFVGSKRPLEEYNGYTQWNYTPSQWAQRSALS